nr:DUF4283 domain-containing protein [Ipomoea batatas]
MSHSRYSKNDVAQDSSERPGKQLSRGMPAMSSSSHYGGGQHAASRHSLDPSISRTLSVGHECDEVFGTRKWKWIPKSDINKQQQMVGYGQSLRSKVVSVVAPEEDEFKLETLESIEDIFQIGMDEVLDIEEEKNFCLLGKFAGRYPGMGAVIQMVRSWKVDCRADYASNDHIIFWFKNADDRDEVVVGGPYLLYGKRLFLEYLPDNFDLDYKDYCKLPVWVRLPNLPRKCWHAKALSRIATKLGKPLFMDRFTKEQKKGDYARILVEMNCSVYPPDHISFKMPNGTLWSQNLIYEYHPPFCSRCGSEKHITIDCPLNKVENNLRQKEVTQVVGCNQPEDSHLCANTMYVQATSDHEKGNESPTTAKETDLAQENENLSRVAGSEIDKTVENMNLDYSHSEPTKMEEAGGENSNVEATNINPEECEFGIMRNMQVVKGINVEVTGKKKVGKKKRNKNKEKLDRVKKKENTYHCFIDKAQIFTGTVHCELHRTVVAPCWRRDSTLPIPKLHSAATRPGSHDPQNNDARHAGAT